MYDIEKLVAIVCDVIDVYMRRHYKSTGRKMAWCD